MRPLRDTLRRVLADGRLRRLELAFVTFGANEFGVWVAVLVYAFQRGGTTLAGVIAVVQLLPAAAFAPLAARLIDRTEGGRALHVGYGAVTVTTCLTGAVMLLDAPPAVVYLAAITAASAVTLIRPAHSALVPEVVSDPADLVAANAASGWVESVSVLVGPAVAGVMIGLDGPGLAIAVLGAGTAVGMLLVAPLGRGAGALQPQPSSTAATWEEAGGPAPEQATPEAARPVLAALAGDPALALLLGLIAVEFIALGALDVLEVVLAVRVLGIGASGAGYLAAMYGVGGALGAVATVALTGRSWLTGAVLAAAVVSGGSLILLGVWPTVVGAFALLCAVGGGHAVLDVAARTILHRVIPVSLRGRVFGLQEGLCMLALAVGSISVPPLVHAGGAEAALLVVGVLLALAALTVAPALTAIERVRPAPRARLAALRASPMFGLLAAPALEDLARALVPLAVPAGEVVVREGEPGDVFYLVASGALEVTIAGRPVRRVTAGDGFGEIALLRDGIRTATVTATDATQLYTLAREPFLAALTGSYDAHRAAEELVVERLALM